MLCWFKDSPDVVEAMFSKDEYKFQEIIDYFTQHISAFNPYIHSTDNDKYEMFTDKDGINLLKSKHEIPRHMVKRGLLKKRDVHPAFRTVTDIHTESLSELFND